MSVTAVTSTVADATRPRQFNPRGLPRAGVKWLVCLLGGFAGCLALLGACNAAVAYHFA